MLAPDWRKLPTRSNISMPEGRGILASLESISSSDGFSFRPDLGAGSGHEWLDYNPASDLAVKHASIAAKQPSCGRCTSQRQPWADAASFVKSRSICRFSPWQLSVNPLHLLHMSFRAFSRLMTPLPKASGGFGLAFSQPAICGMPTHLGERRSASVVETQSSPVEVSVEQHTVHRG